MRPLATPTQGRAPSSEHGAAPGRFEHREKPLRKPKGVYPAIESTYVYEHGDAEARSTRAHGYVVVVGDFRIFVHHTANRVIGSEFAQDMAVQLVIDRSARQTSLPGGWSAGIHCL